MCSIAKTFFFTKIGDKQLVLNSLANFTNVGPDTYILLRKYCHTSVPDHLPLHLYLSSCAVKDTWKNKKSKSSHWLFHLNEPSFYDEGFETNKVLYSDSNLPKKCYICFNDSPSKMMKNAFYFILKAFFVHKIFKFLFWLFGHVEKSTWLEIMSISKFMASQCG